MNCFDLARGSFSHIGLSLFLLLVIGRLPHPEASPLRARQVQGSVALHGSVEPTRVLKNGAQLISGDTLVVIDSTETRIQFSSGFEIILRPETRFVVRHDSAAQKDAAPVFTGSLVAGAVRVATDSNVSSWALMVGSRKFPRLEFGAETKISAVGGKWTTFQVHRGQAAIRLASGHVDSLQPCTAFFVGQKEQGYALAPVVRGMGFPGWADDTAGGLSDSCTENSIQISPEDIPAVTGAPGSPVVQMQGEPFVDVANSFFRLDVSASHDATGRNDGLGVRWDFEGDGTWDYPSGGVFSTNMHVYRSWPRPGRYFVTVQLRDERGNTAGRRIPVRVAEEFEIDRIVVPDTVGMGVVETMTCRILFATDSVLDYSWDFDGDGAYDTVSDTSSVQHRYLSKGKKTVLCMARDRAGRSDTISTSIIVGNAPTLVDAMGPYRVQVNSPLSVVGSVEDLDNSILSYSWDFDGDGKYDWTSTNSSRTQYSFLRAGEYTIRLSAQTNDGARTSDSATVTVFNVPPKAYAGEDVISKTGKPVLLMGTARDPDGYVVKYEWDFEGDGTFDWTSEDTGYVEHSFSSFTSPVLRVMDSDGAMASDTLRIVICPEDMVPVRDGRFCIDPYEWPNKKGQTPGTDITYEQAQALCKKQGKRLCTPGEWETACGGRGDRKKTYPYGDSFGADDCNTLGNSWRENGLAESGHFRYCESGAHVYDMSGNAAEWTYSGEDENAYAYGGFWQSGQTDSRCGSRVRLNKKRPYFYVGFRCCK